MAQSGEPPQGALVVRTYRELDQFVEAFAEGLLNLLLIIGRPGVQKSQAVKAAVGRRACWIDGSATAFGHSSSRRGIPTQAFAGLGLAEAFEQPHRRTIGKEAVDIIDHHRPVPVPVELAIQPKSGGAPVNPTGPPTHGRLDGLTLLHARATDDQ